MQATVFAWADGDNLFDDTIRMGFYCISLVDSHISAWDINDYDSFLSSSWVPSIPVKPSTTYLEAILAGKYVLRPRATELPSRPN